LSDVLRRIGKDSQNLFAECLLKRAGFAFARRQRQLDPRGSWTWGGSAVFDTCRRAGIDTAGLAVADGSGLSRENRCTARQLALLLQWLHGQPHAELFQESLSVAGSDGSLRKRLKDLRGRVYSKTGTMKGVRALAGYVYAANGDAYAFATIFNGYKGGSAPYKEIQDRLCRILAGESVPPTSSSARRGK
jgi:D-alanyl-D-alanine carboxypeptidase/D-alanyl-D-alanine-endopeptidase (penicillin-binding protein 4)